MIGWGVDSGTGQPFWICANSWGNWGPYGKNQIQLYLIIFYSSFVLGGYFLILSGQNECGIEGKTN